MLMYIVHCEQNSVQLALNPGSPLWILSCSFGEKSGTESLGLRLLFDSLALYPHHVRGRKLSSLLPLMAWVRIATSKGLELNSPLNPIRNKAQLDQIGRCVLQKSARKLKPFQNIPDDTNCTRKERELSVKEKAQHLCCNFSHFSAAQQILSWLP